MWGGTGDFHFKGGGWGLKAFSIRQNKAWAELGKARQPSALTLLLVLTQEVGTRTEMGRALTMGSPNFAQMRVWVLVNMDFLLALQGL